jgi:glycosyltransferase involved in cell wall biosynthesis
LWQLPLLAAVRPFRDPPPPATESDPFYSQIKPDVLCGIGVSAQSASVIMTARALSRPSVLFLASNADLDERYGPTSSYVSPYGERGDVCWSAIQNATVIVTQGEDQQQLLNSRFDREGQVLASPIDLSGWDTAAEQQSPLLDRLALSRFVLWVGRADRFHKRPELCLQLARAVEDIAFLMVLNPSDPDVERTIRETAPPNVTIVESVPYAEMPALMQRADVLVSTGSAEYEGAPNVFLQAAAARIPVASLEVSLPVDSHSGFMADGDLDRLVNYLRECWDHPESAQQQGIDARQEVERLHDLPIVTRQLAELLDQATVPTDG